jgi:hypothetical protein
MAFLLSRPRCGVHGRPAEIKSPIPDGDNPNKADVTKFDGSFLKGRFK